MVNEPVASASSFMHDLSVLTFEEAEEKKEKAKFSFSVFRLASVPDRVLILFGITMTGLSGVGLPIFSFLFGDMMNVLGGAPVEGQHEASFYALMLVYLGIGAFLLAGIGAAALEWAGENVVRRARGEYLRAILRQEMGWFDQSDPGTLSSRLNQNCIHIRDGVSLKLGQLTMAIIQFISGYVLGFVRGWKMTLVLTATLPLLLICGALFGYLMTKSSKDTKKEYSAAGSVAEEVITAIRTVVAFGAEDRSARRYNKLAGKSKVTGIKGGIYSGLGMGTAFALVWVSYAIGFWYGGTLIASEVKRGCVQAGCFNGGKALSVFFGVVFGAFSLGQAGPPISALILASVAANDLLELVRRESLINPENKEGLKDVPLKGQIEFKDVSFEYPTRTETPVFSKVNFSINAGETVALVGPSGCGKSTTVQLLQRFYDVSGGSVLLDGRPLTDYNIKWLRDQMSLVSQEPKLFARSIGENILDGRLDATPQEVEEAAKNANAMEFIAQFPDGLDTFVGEGGSQLSGGQKQRVAIARAMLRRPVILILDEATSALDNQSERIVQETLDRLVAAEKRTTIIIAHRLSTIRNADRIIVFDNPSGTGSIVAEEGTHDELMARNGLYSALVNAQALTGVQQPGFTPKSASIATRDSSAAARLRELSHQHHGSFMVVNKRSSSKNLNRKGSAELSNVVVKTVAEDKLKPPSYWRVLSLLKPQWKACAIAVFGSIIAGLIFPVYAVLFSQFMGVYFMPNPEDIKHESLKYALFFLALAGSALVGISLQKCGTEYAGQSIVYTLRRIVFDRIIHNEIGWFDRQENSTGALSQLLSADTLLIKGWTGDNLTILIQNIVTLAVSLIISFLASAPLAAVCLAAFLAILPATYLETKLIGGHDKDLEGDAATAAFVMTESINNIRIVTSYNLQERLIDQFEKVLEADLKKGHRDAIVAGFFYGLSQGLQFFANALQLWYGTKLLQEGKVKSVSAMLRSTTSLLLAGIGIGQTMVFVTDSSKARKAANKLYAVIDRKSQIDSKDPSGTVLNPDKVEGRLAITNVKFSYPLRPEVPIYRGVSFNVEPGQTVAMVGASGCGKSTIIQLLQRFYDIDNTGDSLKTSSITFDGVDIRNCNLKSLRAMMGLVGQEPMLFHTTIAENIRYGKPNATDAEVEEAAKAANAHEFIMSFPKGFQESVGKFGSKLSGGQKQRIAIARAVVRNPKILLLDEATSALDSESERVVQAALDTLMQQDQRTVLVIAHRLATIRNADKIVVFANPRNEGSEIVEVGTHDELMKNPQGVYYGLVKAAERQQQQE